MRGRIFTMLLCCVTLMASAQEKVTFHYNDVDRFWAAFDSFESDTTRNPFEEYFNSGSKPLDSFFQFDEYPAKSVKRVVMKNIAYYDAVRMPLDSFKRYESAIAELFKRFQQYYPPAKFPSIHFVVGAINRGGSTFQNELVIAAEKFSKRPASSVGGLKSMSLDKLPVFALVGLIHFNSKPAPTGHTLLRQCIIQGSADFLMTLLVGKQDPWITDNPAYAYGEQNEERLVREFMARKSGDDFTDWLFNGPGTADRPADLGNWIGYKITEAYYNNQPDKRKAIDDILKINDFERFLALSGYVEQFRY